MKEVNLGASNIFWSALRLSGAEQVQVEEEGISGARHLACLPWREAAFEARRGSSLPLQHGARQQRCRIPPFFAGSSASATDGENFRIPLRQRTN